MYVLDYDVLNAILMTGQLFLWVSVMDASRSSKTETTGFPFRYWHLESFVSLAKLKTLVFYRSNNTLVMLMLILVKAFYFSERLFH